MNQKMHHGSCGPYGEIGGGAGQTSTGGEPPYSGAQIQMPRTATWSTHYQRSTHMLAVATLHCRHSRMRTPAQGAEGTAGCKEQVVGGSARLGQVGEVAKTTECQVLKRCLLLQQETMIESGTCLQECTPRRASCTAFGRLAAAPPHLGPRAVLEYAAMYYAARALPSANCYLGAEPSLSSVRATSSGRTFRSCWIGERCGARNRPGAMGCSH